MMKALKAICAALALSGCAMLTAEAPLFSTADQDGVFALSTGLWAHREDDCTLDPAGSSPEKKDCIDWARITRESDGAWRIEFLDEEEGPLRFVVVPASASEAEAVAPLYVAEATGGKEPGPAYAAIVPRGSLQAPVKRLVMTVVSCASILREGDIPDITVKRDDGRVIGCTAKTKAAVREATRRAVIADLAKLGEEELVWVR